VNSSEKTQSATLSVSYGDKLESRDFEVPELGTVTFGYPRRTWLHRQRAGIALEAPLPAVGSNVTVSLNDSQESTIDVQVLDGTIPTYANLMPYLAPTATPEATPVASPTPSGK
jgi:hypothetical protein